MDDTKTEMESLIARVGNLLEVDGRMCVPAADLRTILDKLKSLLDLNVMAMQWLEGGRMDAKLRAPKWFSAMLIETMARTLAVDDGKTVAMNYASMEGYHPDIGPLEIIVQRRWRKTPIVLLAEAEKHLRNLMNCNSNHARDAQTCTFSMEDRRAALAFIDRPKVEPMPAAENARLQKTANPWSFSSDIIRKYKELRWKKKEILDALEAIETYEPASTG